MPCCPKPLTMSAACGPRRGHTGPPPLGVWAPRRRPAVGSLLVAQPAVTTFVPWLPLLRFAPVMK
eukprot:8921160-Lingulodinium_polyedra.AAC.1